MIDSQLSLYSDSTPSLKTAGTQGQVRLASLSVYNWGSFGDRIHTAPFDREGTLITGDNGSGKSTLIDGLMALLIAPGRASFNIAASQGDRRDRSLVSYMRGSYGTSHDGAGTRVLNKRSKAVVTGLRAMYQYDGGSQVTLMAIFYINQPSNAYRDVNKLYFIAENDFSLKQLLDAFNGRSIREFKQWVSRQPNLTCFDDKFSEYQSIYRQKLAMHNENAPALLARALGLKKIDDLTKLIRELVLEPGEIKEQARYIVAEFADLVATHERLIDARTQVQALQRLVPLNDNMTSQQAVIECLEEEKSGIAVFFARKQLEQLQAEIAEIERSIAALEEDLKRLAEEQKEAESFNEQCHATYLQLGGDQLEELRRSLEQVNERISLMLRDCQRYQALCRDLGLSEALNHQQFTSNQQQIQAAAKEADAELAQREEAYFNARQTAQGLENQLYTLRQEIEAVEQRPNSNIDLKFQNLRDRLSEALSIDVEQLLYVGELIDVQEEHNAWRGAIERALAARKLTLLVPQAHYRRVTGWLNHHHLALTLRAQVVNVEHQESTEFMSGGFLEKLNWRDHPYQRWLQAYLARFDLLCVDSVEELNQTPYAMTVNGLIHLKQGYFEKKDQHRIDDKRYWQLGFDTKAKLGYLRQQQDNLVKSSTEAMKSVELMQDAYEGFRQRLQQQESLLAYEWESIDLPSWEAKRQRFTDRLQALEDGEGDLQKAKVRWDAAKLALQKLNDRYNECNKRLGREEQALASRQKEVTQFEDLAEEPLAPEVEKRLAARLASYDLSGRQLYSACERELNRQLQDIQEQLTKTKDKAGDLLGQFRGAEKWKSYTVDWPSGLEALSDALDYLAHLEAEGLPVLVEQYQERLNKNITQSIALFQTSVEAEFADIRDRIARINQVLAKTEFRPKSYLRLNARRDKYPFIKEFNDKMALALGSATDTDQDRRFKLVNDVVTILATAIDSTRVDDERLLDPRKQMSFYAEEIHQETEAVLDVLDSSSGKSGGEKEAFAGTIVAASLAYVLTPKDEDVPVYATVFLDEAFSNAAEGVAARVIKVFKALQLHINLITPYKNLNVARKAARRLILTERNAATHESRLREIDWELLDEEQARHQQAIKEQALAAGIQFHEH